MSNPYQSPQFAEPVSPHGEPVDREKMRRVAKYQQWVLYALLANIVINIMVMSTRGADPAVTVALGVLALVIVVITMFAVFRLTNELYNVVAAVCCAALMIVPCISLLTLLIVNGRATTFLQQRGVKVGLMGANPDLI
jgi:hypothetical protein